MTTDLELKWNAEDNFQGINTDKQLIIDAENNPNK